MTIRRIRISAVLLAVLAGLAFGVFIETPWWGLTLSTVAGLTIGALGIVLIRRIERAEVLPVPPVGLGQIQPSEAQPYEPRTRCRHCADADAEPDWCPECSDAPEWTVS